MSYRRLFETAKDGILILDALTGKILDVNPFMEQLLDRSHAEFLGKELWQIGLFADIDANRAAFRALQEQGYVRYEHLPLETKTGPAVDVEFVSNTYVADGIEVAQCNIRDITERRRLERQVQEQSEALADLHRRKDEFLAMLSHEIRNPLPAILNAVHLLRHESCEIALHAKAAAIVERQVKQLTLLIDDLLEIARVTTGRVHLRRERSDLRVIVESAVEAARPVVERRKHDLCVSLPPEPVWLDVDACRVEQVVTNLLTNAAKYTLEGGRIWLGLAREKDEAVVRVSDTGIGISPELLPRVFDLFTQGEASLDRSDGGLGIGLTLVQRLVELHGGTVAASSPGLSRGSEFVVRLPAVSVSEPLPSTEPLTGTTQSSEKKRRLLIVDDNTDAAYTLAELLRLSGHEVRVAYSGLAALEAAAECRPEAVLLDIGLPGMSGYEVAARLRRDPKVELNSVCLIAITGYGLDSDRALIRQAGFNHHLVKPVDPRRLHQLLAQLAA
jgi:PAS domain S-box-containing protein